jgi:hypothetical protein
MNQPSNKVDLKEPYKWLKIKSSQITQITQILYLRYRCNLREIIRVC